MWSAYLYMSNCTVNLAGLVVASPVVDYFLLLDGLPEPGRTSAMRVARPLLDALGNSYDVAADGTAFYALQSCANHSCQPNAHALKASRTALTWPLPQRQQTLQISAAPCLTPGDAMHQSPHASRGEGA